MPAWMLESFARSPSLWAWKKYVPWLIEACLLGAPPKTLGRQVSLQAKGQTETPILYENGRVVRNRGILQMAVKVDDTNGPVCPVHTSQKWEGNCVISAERDDPWQCFPRF